MANMADDREDDYSMKKLFLVVFTAILMVFMVIPASAQTYSREYPDLYNSGSPLWIHCTIGTYGEFCIVIDPDTNLNSFGFDDPTGYNLINNTGSQIKGKAYKLDSTVSYLCYWGSYDTLYLRLSEDYSSSYSYTAVKITEIHGTTLDLVDYVADRGNDYYEGLSVDNRELAILLVGCGAIFLVLILFLRRFSRV